MGKIIMSGIVPNLTKPVAGTPLSTYAEGSIIKINESGSPVEFYVAKHDYEAGLNGAGRTLVVRKDCYDKRAWNNTNVNAYATSSIDSWLNGDYKGLLGVKIQSSIGGTKFKYTPGNDNNTVDTLERAIFLLSATELGRIASYINKEGTALEIVNSLKIAYINGAAVSQWTRFPDTSGIINACNLGTDGNIDFNYCTKSYGSRPAFTLPSTIKIDANGQVIE